MASDGKPASILHGNKMCASRRSEGKEIGFFPAADPAYLQGKTHIVSARRAAREFATLRRALASVPAGERLSLFLLSATSTAIFATTFLA